MNKLSFNGTTLIRPEEAIKGFLPEDGLDELMTAKPSISTDPRIATTLQRGLALLACFHINDQGPLSNRELADRAGLPKATVSRLTYTLTKLGFLLHHEKRGYSLGPEVLGPAYVFYARLDIRQVARPYMLELATRPGIYLSLGTRQDMWITSVESVAPDWPVPIRGLFNIRAGIARSAVGHAYLASLAESERKELLAVLRTQHSKTDWTLIERQIERDIMTVAECGYCISIGEWQPMVSGVAVPISSAAHRLRLVLSAGGASQLLPSEELHKIGKELVLAAQKIQHAVGGGSH